MALPRQVERCTVRWSRSSRGDPYSLKEVIIHQSEMNDILCRNSEAHRRCGARQDEGGLLLNGG